MHPIEAKIASLNLILPEPPTPAGSYVPMIVSGDYAFLSGQISKSADGQILAGKVGAGLTPEEGKAAAHAAALNVLSLIRHGVGFDRLEQVVRMVGYVQAADGFSALADIVNGASDLLRQVLGQAGEHARSAVGVSSLPLNAAIELEVTLKLKS